MATFDVERVSHGQVPIFIVVYNKIDGSESKALAVGNTYLVSAYTLSANDQQLAIAADARSYLINARSKSRAQASCTIPR